MQITNNSEGPRGVNALVNSQPMLVVLQPGESRDLTLVNEDCPVFAGMVRTRDFLVEQPQAAGPARKVVNEDGPPVLIQDDKSERSDKADKPAADDKSAKK